MGNPDKEELVDVLWDKSGIERPAPGTKLSPDAQRRNQIRLYQLYKGWVHRKDPGATIFLPPTDLLQVIALYRRDFRTIMPKRLSLATDNSYLIQQRIARFLSKHLPSGWVTTHWERWCGAHGAIADILAKVTLRAHHACIVHRAGKTPSPSDRGEYWVFDPWIERRVTFRGVVVTRKVYRYQDWVYLFQRFRWAAPKPGRAASS